MKLTKYEHACVVLEEQGGKLVIDPGGFTAEFGGVENIAAVVVTHVHPDHYNPEHLERIFGANPDVQVFTTQEVADQLGAPNVKVVRKGEEVTAGPFTMRFGGELHELIHESMPRPHNISVFVNNVFYYPGDSYTLPDKPVNVLAVPANAPWMKIADSIDYIATVRPERCFPTHNGLLSENGQAVYGFGLKKACEANSVSFEPLMPGESIEL
jgi:L-ascorbate metabolism protein UlaG (beta-lactamase superfamily)